MAKTAKPVDRAAATRLQELRYWRKKTQQEVADLAGISQGYLSQLENGHAAIDSRHLTDRLADALQVAPSELLAEPLSKQLADPAVGAAQAHLAAIEAALSDVGYGDAAVAPRPWPHVESDLRHLNGDLRPRADYAAQGAVLPRLILELQALVSEPSAPSTEVLTGLMDVYHAASVLTKNLGARGLPSFAAFHAHRAAQELDDPAYLGLAAWLRGNSLGGSGRDRAIELFTQGTRDLEPHLGDRRAMQMYGSLHLQAALASAALRRPEDAQAHLDEADDVARSLGVPGSGQERGFGTLYFGPDNAGITRLTVAVEEGEGGRAREIASTIVIDRVPSAARQAMYWGDLGRGLASERRTRADGVMALRRAEDIAPVRIRAHPLMRATVTNLLPRKLPVDAGRELRGMAYRMGIAS